MEVRRISTEKEWFEIEKPWNGLLKKSAYPTIFQTHEWLTTWWKYFGGDSQLYILAVEHNDTLVGIAPLMSKKREIMFIGTPHIDYGDIISSENHKNDVLKAVFGYLLRGKHRLKNIQLEEIPDHSSTIPLSKAILKPLSKYHHFPFCNPCVSVNLKGMSKEDMKKLLNKKEIKRHSNYFKRNGALTYASTSTVAEATSVLSTLIKQHKQIWDSRGMPSMFHDKKYVNFFQELIDRLVPAGELGMCTISFNGKVVAATLGFIYGKTFISYCQSHDISHSKGSPGMILHKYFIEHLYNDGFEEVDFSRGKEAYKFRFANKTTSNCSIIIHKNIFSHLPSVTYHSMKEWVMHHEKLHKAIHKFKHKCKQFLNIFF